MTGRLSEYDHASVRFHMTNPYERCDIKLVSVLPRVPVDGVGAAGDVYVERYLRELLDLGWAVSVVTPATRENTELLKRRSLDVPILVAPRRYRPPRVLRFLLGLLTGFGSIPGFLFWRALGPLARNELQQADVVDFQFVDMIRYAPALRRRLPDKVFVATAHDVMDQSLGRAASSPDPKIRLRALLSRRQVSRAERRGLNACNRVFVFNPENARLLARLGVRTEVLTTPPAVDLPPMRPKPDASAARVLFAAAFWRSENDEAALWFLDHVWPAVLKSVPDAKVRFAGGRPSPSLLSRRSSAVEVTGFLDNMMTAYDGVSVVVAPLLRGAGLKFKVVQALALGYPTIVTSIAAEGVNDLLGEVVLVPIDDSKSFASAVVSALQNTPVETHSAAELVRSRLNFSEGIREQAQGYQTLHISGPRTGAPRLGRCE